MEANDDLYEQAKAIVLRDRRPSPSYLQRMLRIGYSSASGLMERLEAEGIVSAANHIGKREVLK
jgi:DNA segregation ATPase FtsK/SpoIIIE, S-DNA-T family